MIESCTKRRMLLGITFLGGLTVLALIIESHWTDSSSKLYVDSFENTSSCISGDDYEIMSECHPCTAFEIASESIGVCVHARYKEVLKCKSGETITRSCDKVAWLEERTFWKFEAFMFALAVISCLSTYWRENILRHRMIKKIAKQLRISV
ncbi:protein JTB isoform X1 [Pseudomyrmex gracilis]|uniref:protein JTB isoform X1 n=1 Tax=Pseudomyrmex gracilis TaxID=219809 RepID=UPI0009952B0A|nr:protein JTB isoform X1 [Pseudomyrmex gracilis]XP_020277685.1 protein JTB isoform X1 [Pseudomyrmex gracilis]